MTLQEMLRLLRETGWTLRGIDAALGKGEGTVGCWASGRRRPLEESGIVEELTVIMRGPHPTGCQCDRCFYDKAAEGEQHLEEARTIIRQVAAVLAAWADRELPPAALLSTAQDAVWAVDMLVSAGRVPLSPDKTLEDARRHVKVMRQILDRNQRWAGIGRDQPPLS